MSILFVLALVFLFLCCFKLKLTFRWGPAGIAPATEPPLLPTFMRVEAPVEDMQVGEAGGMRTLQEAVREVLRKGQAEKERERQRDMMLRDGAKI